MAKDSYPGETTVAWPMRGRTFEDFRRSLDEFEQFHPYVPKDAEISTYECFGTVWISVRYSG